MNGRPGRSRVLCWMIVVAFESDYKEIMRGTESIKGNWFAILNKRRTTTTRLLSLHHH